MDKPDYHFFVCNSFRGSGEPSGVCYKKGAMNLLQYLEGELADRGISALVSSTGCLKVCDRGPAMVVYPIGDWYGNLDEAAIDTVLDAIENGTKAEDFLLT